MNVHKVGYWTVKVANKYMILVSGEITQRIPLPVTAKTVNLDDSLGTKIRYRNPETVLETFSSVSILAIFDPRFDRLDLVEPTTNDWMEFFITMISDNETAQQAKEYLIKLKDRLNAQAEVLSKIVDNLPKNGIFTKSLKTLFGIDWKGSILEVWRAYGNAFPEKSLMIKEKTPEMIKVWIKNWLTTNPQPETTVRSEEVRNGQ